jgi:Tfp pilus assembly protein PilO
MKVKLLLTPLLIVAAIALLIWFVYPAYTNGTDGLSEKYSQLKAADIKLADIQKKAANVDALFSQLSANGDKKDTVVKFIPENIKEEEVIDNMNFMASSSGLAVSNDSVTQPVLDLASAQAVPAPTPAVPDAAGAMAAPVQSAPQAVNFNANLAIVGSYENVKTFLGKLDSFSRFDKIVSYEIKKPASIAGTSVGTGNNNTPAPADYLEADLVLNFNYLPKSTLSSDTNPVFLTNSLDMKAADDIKNLRNGDVLKLNIDQTGKANPFLP